MKPETFARIFIQKLSKGKEVINVGQSVALEKISRFFPKLAFKMVNK